MTRETSPTGDAQEKGYTLLELLIALAILGLLSAVVPSLIPATPEQSLSATTQKIVDSLRLARAVSMSQSSEQRVVFKYVDRTFEISGRKPVSIPETTTLEITSTYEKRRSDTDVAVRFFPDGSSNGARIRLSQRNKKIDIHVPWLTGKVYHEDLSE